MMKFFALVAIALLSSACGMESASGPDIVADTEDFIFDSDYRVELSTEQVTCNYGADSYTLGTDLRVEQIGQSVKIFVRFDGQGTDTFVGTIVEDGFDTTMIVVRGDTTINNRLVGHSFGSNPTVDMTQQVTEGNKSCHTILSGLAQ